VPADRANLAYKILLAPRSAGSLAEETAPARRGLGGVGRGPLRQLGRRASNTHKLIEQLWFLTNARKAAAEVQSLRPAPCQKIRVKKI